MDLEGVTVTSSKKDSSAHAPSFPAFALNRGSMARGRTMATWLHRLQPGVPPPVSPAESVFRRAISASLLALYRTAISSTTAMPPDPSARYYNPLLKIALAFGAGLMIAALL
jgi:hypothetical protein